MTLGGAPEPWCDALLVAGQDRAAAHRAHIRAPSAARPCRGTRIRRETAPLRRAPLSRGRQRGRMMPSRGQRRAGLVSHLARGLRDVVQPRAPHSLVIGARVKDALERGDALR